MLLLCCSCFVILVLFDRVLVFVCIVFYFIVFCLFWPVRCCHACAGVFVFFFSIAVCRVVMACVVCCFLLFDVALCCY